MTKELNERLAKWAGLHRNEPTGDTWWDKDGNTVDILFTESLDAQAEHLWPKLTPYQIEVLADMLGSSWWGNDAPARACAQAIGKLIQEDKA